MDPLSETDPGDKDLILSNEAISLVRLAKIPKIYLLTSQSEPHLAQPVKTQEGMQRSLM
jgi:hypothetical protein